MNVSKSSPDPSELSPGTDGSDPPTRTSSFQPDSHHADQLSQEHGMAGVGRDLWGSPSPTAPKADPQVSQESVQEDFSDASLSLVKGGVGPDPTA